MNVLIASSYTAPQSGNFIASLIELGKALRKQTDEAVFIFPISPNTQNNPSWLNWLKEEKFTVYLIDRSASAKDMLTELNRIIQKHDITVLHTHFGMYEHLITHYRNKLNVKKILVHHHFGVPSKGSAFKQKLKNLIISARYRLLNIDMACVSKDIAASYKLCKRSYVPNSLSLTRYVAEPRTREVCRTSLGITSEQKVCLFLGWSLEVKGLDIAVQAIDICRKTNPNILLCIVGFGCTPSQKAIDYIQSTTNVDPHSEWIHYWPDTEDMYAYHKAADVFLSASRSEGFSYALLETLATNTPACVSNIPGNRWSHAYENVYVYSTEDASACAEAILKALNTPKSTSTANRITQDYSINKWCEQVISLYYSR